MRRIFFFNQILLLAIVSCGLFLLSDGIKAESSDAIAMRVFPNPEHLSAISWYQKKGFSGSPQSVIVDGYEAVRDGQTVYVNVANAVDNAPADGVIDVYYTNIYLISYNKEAEKATSDIFDQILLRWKFNANIITSGNCYSEPDKRCVDDIDCSIGDYCNSEKASLIRDVRRLSSLRDIEDKLESYYSFHNTYPKLSAGTYIPGKTISTWPSWTSTFAREIGANIPKDPVNKLGDCGGSQYDEITCWDNTDKVFATELPEIPMNSMVFIYNSYNSGQEYNLCTVFESVFPVDPSYDLSLCSDTCIDEDEDDYGRNLSEECEESGFDCNDSDSSIHPGAEDYCDNFIDEDCSGADLPCPEDCIDEDEDGYDICSPGDFGDDGELRDCNDFDDEVYPGHVEACNGYDDNCNFIEDEDCDNDNDGYCNCFQTFSPGSSCGNTHTDDWDTFLSTCDCDDDNDLVNPAADEICDNLNSNCSNFNPFLPTDPSDIDEGCDEDGDGYCSCIYGSGVGYDPDAGIICGSTDSSNFDLTCDCNDASDIAYPSLEETGLECFDEVDNDCNGAIDDEDPGCNLPCFDDDDGGVGDGFDTCDSSNPNRLDENDEIDCDDTNSLINPGMAEFCDGFDNNCVDGIDEGCSCTNGDTLDCGVTDVGECTTDEQLCSGGTWGICPAVFPEPNEDCGTPGDQDCDGFDDASDEECFPDCFNEDGDGFDTCHNDNPKRLDEEDQDDCDDGDAEIYPGRPEICDDGEDQDCDLFDEACAAVCTDDDGDNYGVCPNCGIANGCLANGHDCDDGIGWINPGATETCDGNDNNCSDPDHGDGIDPLAIDEGCDDDDDDYCDETMQLYNVAVISLLCPNTPFTVDGMFGDDCDDLESVAFPVSPESDCSDGIDNDCNGDIDCDDTACATDAACLVGGGCSFTFTFSCSLF